jgi:cytoskeleton protein RodZ
MDSFGTTLKREREERGLTLETVAALIHIDRSSLEALERDEYDGLPDHEVMLEGLHHYAECLQVDAELMIEHYERERRASLERLAESVEPNDAPASRSRSTREVPRALIVTVCLLALLGVGAWLIFGRGDSGGSAAKGDVPPASEPAAAPDGSGSVDLAPADAAPVEPTPAADTPAGAAQAQPESTEPAAAEPTPPRAEAEPTAPQRRETSETSETATIVLTRPGGMSVPEYGVGTGVEDRALVGARDRFAEGTQAWFWTLVEGGASGDRIEHVWLHEGVEAARIGLDIGGARWRTQSAKTLRSSGNWAVEARDANGRVLARTEFVCTP